MELNFAVFWCVTQFTLVDRYQPIQWMCSVNTHPHLMSWYVRIYRTIQCHIPQDLSGCSLLWEPASWLSHVTGSSLSDKECPMYNQASSSDQMGPQLDPLLLVQQMREDGLAMKRSALSIQQNVRFSHNQVGYYIFYYCISIYIYYVKAKWGKFAVIRSLFEAGRGTVTADRGGTVVKALCYKLEGRCFDPRRCLWNFSLT